MLNELKNRKGKLSDWTLFLNDFIISHQQAFARVLAFHTLAQQQQQFPPSIENVAKRVLHLLFDCSLTASVNDQKGDLLLCVVKNKAQRRVRVGGKDFESFGKFGCTIKCES